MAILKWIKWLWGWVSHLSTAVGLVPQICVVIAFAVLGWVSQIPALYVLLAGLVGTAAVACLFKYLSRAVAWFIVLILVVGTVCLSFYQYNNYQLVFDGFEAALIPSDLERTYAAGQYLNIGVVNKYDFPIFYRLDRNYIVSERAMVDSEDDTDVQEIAPNSKVGLPTQAIVFSDPLPAATLRGGSVDFLICYGRSRSDLRKGLAVKARYQIRFLGPDANVETTYSNREVKFVSCN